MARVILVGCGQPETMICGKFAGVQCPALQRNPLVNSGETYNQRLLGVNAL